MSSYKLRRVPENWEHPKNNEGQYIPLLDRSYAEYSRTFEESKEMWNKGFQESSEPIGPKEIPNYIPKEPEYSSMTFEEWDGEKKLPVEFRPDWPVDQQTHFQMYEDVTEGTPVSPIFEKVEDLARWLANELNDDRYPYTSTKWLQILNSSSPSVKMTMIIVTPIEPSLN